MTRVFNIVMLFLLAGIYYVQNDGFGRSNGTVSASAAAAKSEAVQAEKNTVVANQKASGTVVSVSAKKVAINVPEQPDSNVLSRAEIEAVKSRFQATKLLSSTMTREVPLMAPNKVIKSQEPVLLVSGSLVNARSAPTTESSVLAKLKRGTEVAATGETNGVWAEVLVLDTGDTVWMHSRFLRERS